MSILTVLNDMAIDISIGSKAEELLEALRYLQRIRGSVFVVKFGGSFMDTDRARIDVARDLVLLSTVGIRVVVVHGGGPAINEAMAEAQIEPVWKNGLRYTGSETISIVERTLMTRLTLVFALLSKHRVAELRASKGKIYSNANRFAKRLMVSSPTWDTWVM